MTVKQPVQPKTQKSEKPLQNAPEVISAGPEITTAVSTTAAFPTLPSHPTARPMRQSTILQLQRRHGNDYVQRMLTTGTAQNKRDPETETAESPLEETFDPFGGNGFSGAATPPPTSNNGHGTSNIVQRQDDSTLPPVPNYQLTPPSLFPPRQPGLLSPPERQLHLDPTLMAEMYVLQIRLRLDPATIHPLLQQTQPSFFNQPLPPVPASSSTPPGPNAQPSAPRQGTFGDVWKAISAHPEVNRALTNLQTMAADQARLQASRLGAGDWVALVTTGVMIGSGVVAGIASSPEAQQFVLEQMNGKVIPVPFVPSLRVELNTAGQNLMFGLHLDVGAILPPSLGFGPGSSSALGGPPSPQPPPWSGGVQRAPAENGHVSNGIVQRATATNAPEAAEAGPTEAEKAAAKAKAQAAMSSASQAFATGQAEADKSRAKKEAEKSAGDTAKQKVESEKGATTPPKEKGGGETAVNGAGPKTTPAAKEGTAEVSSVAKQLGTAEKAPASAQEDPAFAGVVSNVKTTAKKEQEHPPATAKAAESQAAAESPSSEISGKAAGNQVGEMETAPTPGFDAAGFKAKLMDKITSMAPKTSAEADEFKDSNKLSGVKGEMQGQATAEKEKAQTPLETATNKSPDSGSVEPKPVTPLEANEPGPPPPSVGADAAAPKAKTPGEVEKPLQEDSQSVDNKMAEADVTEDQLKKSNEPEFTGALDSKKEAQEHAKSAPDAYRKDEQGIINKAEAEATAVAQDKTAGMHTDKAGLLNQVGTQQQKGKTADEKARAEVGTKIQGIYNETKTKVETILNSLDKEVEDIFNPGAEAAKKAFEDYVDARMEAYKEERYGGWLGWARWIDDKFTGMPAEVNVFYTEGRQLFISKMDAVIDSVVEMIGRRLTEAKAEVANGKKRIQEYVNTLPDNLRSVGEQAAQDIQGKFDELEQSVDNKQNELIDSLAQKYQENLQAVDARIEEMKAANRGLIDKAMDAIGGVIKTILQLKDMLLNVLARAAAAIEKIISDPIGFLGNLIAGVKLGLENFVANIGTHLKKGLMSWLFGAMAEAGIQMPESFDLKGILSLVMQVLGLTWENLRARAVKIFGEKVVAVLETAFEVFKIVKEQGIGGLWEFIKDQLSNLKDMVLDGIKDMVITEVIKAGVQWLMSMLGGPAGAFIKACKMIYDIIMWFVNNGSQLLALVNAVIDSVTEIANGNISAAAKYVEDSLAKAIPAVIGFLASLLGLGGISQKIKGIIQKIQEPVNKAIDWVLNKAKAVVKKLGKMLGIGKDKDKDKEKAKSPDVQAGLSYLHSQERGVTDGGGVSREEAERIARNTKQQHPVFQSITVVDGEGKWNYDYVVARSIEPGSQPKEDGGGGGGDDLKKRIEALKKRIFEVKQKANSLPDKNPNKRSWEQRAKIIDDDLDAAKSLADSATTEKDLSELVNEVNKIEERLSELEKELPTKSKEEELRELFLSNRTAHIPASSYSRGKHVRGRTEQERKENATNGEGQYLAALSDSAITALEKEALGSGRIEDRGSNNYFIFHTFSNIVGYSAPSGNETGSVRVEWSQGSVHSHPR